MKLRLDFATEIPYLTKTIIKDFANLIIKSDDGTELKINHLLLISWSNYFKDILQVPMMNNYDIVISSNLNNSDLKMLCDFITKGIY